MKNILSLVALVISLGLIIFLYLQLTSTQESLRRAEQRYADCEKVTFQLQNQLTAKEREGLPPSPE